MLRSTFLPEATTYSSLPPRMPWGISRSEVIPALRRWAGEVEDLGPVPFEFPRGLQRFVVKILTVLPWVKNNAPGVTHVRLGISKSRGTR